MIDEKNYWEEQIAWFVLVFTIYPFIKDNLTESRFLSSIGHDSTVAIFTAIIFSHYILWLAKKQLSHLKKKDMNNLFNENFD